MQLIYYIYYKIFIFLGKSIRTNFEEHIIPKVVNPEICLRVMGVKIGKNVRIGHGLILHNFNKDNLVIHNNVHVGKDVFIDCSDQVIIMNNSCISMRATILTHRDFGDSKLSIQYSSEKSPLIISEHVYIGANVTIINSVKKVSKNCLIAAGSVLLEDTSENGLYAGVPAKIKRKVLE